MKKLLLALAALFAGASGLGLETLFLHAADLALGYGRASAVGLAVFVGAWAVGAFAAGRARSEPLAGLLRVGVALAAFSGPLAEVAIRTSSAMPGTVFPILAVVGGIGAIGLLQGAMLPLIVRQIDRARRSHDAVQLAVAANLAGAVAGAYTIGDRAVAAWGRVPAAWIGGACALAAALAAWLARESTSETRLRIDTRAPNDARARSDTRAQRDTQVRNDARAQSDTRAQGDTPSEPRVPRDMQLSSDTSARIDADEPLDATARGEMRRACAIVGLATMWMCTLQWVGLRLGVLWLDGMQPALSSILCASIASLCIGASVLPSVLPRDRRAVPWTIALCAAATLWPFAAPHAMGALGALWRSGGADEADRARAALERAPMFLRALVLVGPSMAAFGAVVPVLHRALDTTRTESAARLGRLYLHESWGALVGIPVVHEWIVPRWGLNGAIATALMIGAVSIVISFGAPTWIRALLGVGSAVACACVLRAAPIARASPPLANPALDVRALAEDRDFCVAVVDDGIQGERTLLTDGFRAAGTGVEYRYMRVLGHLPLLLHAHPRNVAVLALGTGTTVGSVALHSDVQRITVLELSRAVVDMAPWFDAHNRGALAEGLPGLLSANDESARVVVRLGDGRAHLAATDERYDVLTMEPLLPDAPAAVYLYTREFYSIAKRCLADGGLVCQWVPPHALEPATFEAVVDAFASSFAWSSVWVFGAQVMLVGGEAPPVLDPARFEGLAPLLRGELSDLGLADASGLLARYVGDGSRWRTCRRPLTDRDPWIVHRPRRASTARLSDLPENFAELSRRATEPPADWLARAGAKAQSARACVRALRGAEEAHAREEARLRGGTPAPDDARESDGGSYVDALQRCADEPEVRAFAEETRFLDDLRRGVALLASHASGDVEQEALRRLLGAATVRRERGDVHAYVAVALERLGASAAARKAAETARARCRGIARTREGLRARALGLSDELWSVLSAP